MKKEFELNESSSLEVEVNPKVDFSKMKLTELDTSLKFKQKLDENTEITAKISGDIIKGNEEDIKIEGSITHKF